VGVGIDQTRQQDCIRSIDSLPRFMPRFGRLVEKLRRTKIAFRSWAG